MVSLTKLWRLELIAEGVVKGVTIRKPMVATLPIKESAFAVAEDCAKLDDVLFVRVLEDDDGKRTVVWCNVPSCEGCPERARSCSIQA